MYNVAKYGAEQHALSIFAGDNWKMTQQADGKLRPALGSILAQLRDQRPLGILSTSAPNPGAGDLPGRVAYAGNKWGPASSGERYPEDAVQRSVRATHRCGLPSGNNGVLRAGYGILYTQAFYPGWGGGMNLDGFNPQVTFGGSLGGYVPAFYLDTGVPRLQQGAEHQRHCRQRHQWAELSS